MLAQKHTYIVTIGILFLAFCACREQPKKKPTDPHADHQIAVSGADAYIDSLNRGIMTKDTLKGSPKRLAMANIGPTHVHITYRSPGVKDRIIWGGLVPYGQVWVTGAHTATSISFSHDVEINKQQILAGTYAIFTVPGEQEWVFILNKNYNQHLADDYSQDEDVLRMPVQPVPHTDTPRLTYSVEELSSQQGKITMAWDTLAIVIPFDI